MPMIKNKAMAIGALVLSLGLVAAGEASAARPNEAHIRRELRGAVHHNFDGPAYATPGFTFIPGHGIAGEACDLPTSDCPNDQRNAN